VDHNFKDEVENLKYSNSFDPLYSCNNGDRNIKILNSPLSSGEKVINRQIINNTNINTNNNKKYINNNNFKTDMMLSIRNELSSERFYLYY
jgi:hypothetical protein